MTFPYPLTPEVRADLWRFLGDDPEEMMPGLPALPNGTWARPNGNHASAPNALLDTPFARAFVAWRRAREERSCYTCGYNSSDDCTIPRADPMFSETCTYAIKAGCRWSDDAMPTDRTLKCPGWKVKS